MSNSFKSLGNRSKDRQRFVVVVVLMSALNWSERLSNFKNVGTPSTSVFKPRIMLGFAKLIWYSGACNMRFHMGCIFWDTNTFWGIGTPAFV